MHGVKLGNKRAVAIALARVGGDDNVRLCCCYRCVVLGGWIRCNWMDSNLTCAHGSALSCGGWVGGWVRKAVHIMADFLWVAFP